MKHSHMYAGSGAGPKTVNIFFFGLSANPSHVFEEHLRVRVRVCVWGGALSMFGVFLVDPSVSDGSWQRGADPRRPPG